MIGLTRKHIIAETRKHKLSKVPLDSNKSDARLSMEVHTFPKMESIWSDELNDAIFGRGWLVGVLYFDAKFHILLKI